MWPVDAATRAAVSAGETATLTLDVLRAGEPVATDVPVISARVAATLATSDGRSAGLVVDRGVTDAGLLDPLTDTAALTVRVGGDLARVPLFTGRVDAVTETEQGDAAVALLSRRQELRRALFEEPWVAAVGGTFIAEVRRVIADVDATWAVDDGDLPYDTHPEMANSLVPGGLVWESDRERAVDDLTDAVNVLWLPDRTGGFKLLSAFFGERAGQTPDLVVYDGEDGSVTRCSRVISRQDVVNSVTVVVERTDGSPPVRVTVRDDDAGSPTRWGGSFGKQSRVVKLTTPATDDDAFTLATRLLRSTLALARTWRIELPSQPLLDPGDVIGLWYRGEPTTQLVESVTYSTTATATTVLGTRELPRDVS